MKNLGGRPPGSPNKITKSVKEALTLAFDQLGGVDELVKWAKRPKNRAAYYQLWGRLAPREVHGTLDVALLTPEERKARIAQLLNKASGG